MTARARLVLIVLGAAALALSTIVLVRNRSPDDELLAGIGFAGGLAMIIVALPRGHEP
jgi:hypothetical protein